MGIVATTPPTGGGTGRRIRSRYASDEQIERAAKLALKHGVKLRLDAAGGVEVLGKLDSRGEYGVASGAEETPDEALAAWEANCGHSRHP